MAVLELLIASLILGYWSVGMVLLTSPPKRWTPKEYPIPSPPPAPIEDRVQPTSLANPYPSSQVARNNWADILNEEAKLATVEMNQIYESMLSPSRPAVVPDQFGPFLSKTQKRKKEKKEFIWAANEHYKEWLKNKSPNAMADLEGTNINQDLDLERML